MPTASVIIPTLGRADSLRDCLESLWDQSCQDFEIIKVTEEGHLATLRNKGANQAKGKYLVFIDDDVVCSKGWMESIISSFRDGIDGVSGPAVITKEYRRNRDIFRFRYLHELFTGFSVLPGHISKAGAWTTGACEENCSYEGEVEFLEACNMSFRADTFRSMGGFDESYKGIGDWSEPDLAFRIRKAGGSLWFSRDASLEHRPSKSGAFKKRSKDSRNRMENYELFSSRWIKPCCEHSLYKQFMRRYYALEALK